MLSPVVSSTLAATALAAASNIAAQQIEHRNHEETSVAPLSLPELIRFIVLNLIVTPPNFYWQYFLERQFPARKPVSPARSPRSEDGSPIELEKMASDREDDAEEESSSTTTLDWKNTAMKWFMDCITIGAVLNTVAFLIIMGLLKGRSLDEIGTALRTETLPIIWASYTIWPLASVVNFAIIPVDWRVIFLSAVNLVWGVYMSFMAARQ